MIKLENISKEYNETSVLKDINLEMKSGHFYVLLGHNGAGKSTLLNIISGTQKATNGKGSIDKFDLFSDWGEFNSNVGLISENIDYNLPVPLHQFIKMYSSFYPNWNKTFFDTTIKRQNINQNRQFSSFSRGQKMQIALIANLAKNPQLLLIDEVTSVLDPYARNYFINLLDNYVKQGGLVIMTSNIIQEVENTATDIIILKDGNVLLNSSVDNISKLLIKVRVDQDKDHQLLSATDECVWVGTNSDRSQSYIMAKEKQEILEPHHMHDNRKITLEEIFLYYNELAQLNGHIPQEAA